MLVTIEGSRYWQYINVSKGEDGVRQKSNIRGPYHFRPKRAALNWWNQGMKLAVVRQYEWRKHYGSRCTAYSYVVRSASVKSVNSVNLLGWHLVIGVMKWAQIRADAEKWCRKGWNRKMSLFNTEGEPSLERKIIYRVLSTHMFSPNDNKVAESKSTSMNSVRSLL